MAKFCLIVVLLSVSSVSLLGQDSFKDKQAKYPRYRNASVQKKDWIAENVSFPLDKNFGVFIRAFKYEEILEVWAYTKDKYEMIVAYDFCSSSGVLGPKRLEGDLQILIYYFKRGLYSKPKMESST